MSIKNSLPYLKRVTSLLCGPRADLWPFYIGFSPIQTAYILNVTQQCPCASMLIFRAWATCGTPKPKLFAPRSNAITEKFLSLTIQCSVLLVQIVFKMQERFSVELKCQGIDILNKVFPCVLCTCDFTSIYNFIPGL